MRLQRLANITCYKCGLKVITEKTTLVQQVQCQIKLRQHQHAPTTVTEIVTASCAVPKSSLVTSLKNLQK